MEDKETFYKQVQAITDKLPKRDLKILMRDMNAKPGADNINRKLIMGRYGIGQQNTNDKVFTEFCIFSDLLLYCYCKCIFS